MGNLAIKTEKCALTAAYSPTHCLMEMSKAVTQELYKPKIGRKIRVFGQRLKNNILMKEKSAFVSLD